MLEARSKGKTTDALKSLMGVCTKAGHTDHRRKRKNVVPIEQVKKVIFLQFVREKASGGMGIVTEGKKRSMRLH